MKCAATLISNRKYAEYCRRGICTQCCRAPAVPPHTMCDPCRLKTNARLREYRRKHKRRKRAKD